MSSINESAIKTPGVYINEISTLPPSVAQVSTAVPVFIGYTQKAIDDSGNSLKNIPTKIYSFLEYKRYFGLADNETTITVTVTKKSGGVTATAANATPSKFKMYYDLRLYFDNGGGPCYILSVGDLTATPADTDLSAGLDILEAYNEPTLILFPEGRALTEDKYYALILKAIAQCAKLQSRFTIVDVMVASTTVTVDTIMTEFRTKLSATSGLEYAAAYYPDLKTTYEFQYQESAVNVTIHPETGSDVSTTLDKLNDTTAATLDKVSYNAALLAIQQLGPVLAPSAAMAGVYAYVDASRGVWKAPANIGLQSVYDVASIITDQQQEGMNIDTTAGKSVNAIRPFVGKGIIVWGARTLDGNSNEWRYISVRRFFIMVEQSVKNTIGAFVFEPNDANTWVKVRSMIENYLTLLWRQGALAGAKPEQAFFVRVGIGQTMSAIDILEGRMIVEVGMAAVRPAEFIILRFSHKMQES